MSSVINAPSEGKPPAGTDWRPGWRAMAGKEWKENLKWAALALLGLGIALAYGVYRAHPENPDSFPLVWSSVTTALTIGAPLAGLLLGLLQTVPEQRRDLWAFLIHRPATRSTLFWGKVTPGLGLYLLATLLPLLGVALWARAPGHLAAPFAWGLTLGGVGAVLAGIPFYFAGMLAGLRPARWWGSRAVPVAAALTAAAATLGAPDFWQAALIVLFSASLLGVAARASFLTTGVYEGQPRAGQAALGLGLYVGLCTVLVGLVAFGVTAWQTLLPAPRRGQPSFTQYQITRDGRMVRTTYSDTAQGYTDVRDLNGVPAKPPLGTDGRRDWNSGNNFLRPEYSSSPWGYGSIPSYSSVDRYLPPFPGPGNTTISGSGEQWYYDLSARQLVVYSLPTRLQIGVFGPSGFVPASVAPEGAGRFPSPLRQMSPPAFNLTALRYDHSLYLVSSYLRTARPISLGTVLAPVLSVEALTPGDFEGGPAGKSGFQVGTAARDWVLSGAGDVLFSVAQDYDRHVYSSVSTAMTPDGQRFLFQYNARDQTQASYVVTYDAHGIILRRDSLPSLSPMPEYVAAPFHLFGLGIPLLLDTGYYTFITIGHRLGIPQAEGYWHWFYDAKPIWRQEWILFCVMSALSGLLASGLAWGIGRRCAYTKVAQWAWVVGAFWVGLPGVLLLLSLRDWPAREACPNCGRPRVVTRDLCEHCGAPFAPPVPDGTEIFEGEAEESGAVPVQVGTEP